MFSQRMKWFSCVLTSVDLVCMDSLCLRKKANNILFTLNALLSEFNVELHL